MRRLVPSLLFGLLAVAAALVAAPPATRPNIIVIVADDLGYGDLGSYGQSIIQTPNLDRMAAEGIRFTQFYAGSTVCAPSRSVLMTGQHLGHTRVRGNAGAGNAAAQTLAESDVTVARVLQQAGYATALIGKWGLGETGSAGEPNRQGFDYFFGFVNQTHAHNHYPDFLWRNGEKVTLPNVVTPGGAVPGAGYATTRVQYASDVFFEEARAFLTRSQDRPFFLELALTVPHANNERARALGDGQEVPDYGAYASKDWADSLKGQAAMISRMDRQVGELLAQLKTLEIDDRTLVVFTSDNGPHKEGGPAYDPDFFDANGPFSGIKRSLTDGGIRVPFIVRWPGRIKAGVTSAHVGYFGDVMATLSELAGAKPPAPASLDSLSLAPTLLGRGTQAKHEYLYWEFHEGGFSQAVLLEGRWKGIRLKLPTMPIQLFDLGSDVGETTDLAARQPDLVRRITAIMRDAHVDNEHWKWPAAGAPSAEPAQADILVYGCTAGGITAAIQARHMGKSVVMICPERHLGGLTAGGLGWTDSGDKAVIGGLSREFYHRVWQHYQKPQAWRWQQREQYGNKGQGTAALDQAAGTMWIFEPHVAEAVFEAWVAELKIPIVRDAWLDREKGVRKDGDRIASITTLDGRTYAARMFIDATYEGDLMAAAGVDYHVGRESTKTYGEQWAGVQTGVLHHRHHFGVLKTPVSPYVIPGDSSSGILPGISADPPGVYGDGDKKVQAYCFRLCLTQVPANRVPFPRPAGYNPRQYELLLRVFVAGWRETFDKFDPIPNFKTDTNNHGPFSTDNIGRNWDYPEASDERRRQIVQEHVDYQQGWLYFIANDPRVPANVRTAMAAWGLAKDEFVDNGHWPHQIYVREARRMVGRYVMTEHELLKKRPTPEPVGMGSYGIDSHNIQRYITPEGYVQNEGDIGVSTGGPYQISYGSLVPRKGQVANLLVPVALSSSHIAYGSIRMEPVFMILGQSAATAAALAVDGRLDVQDVPYDTLRARLLADGQVLESVGVVPLLAGSPRFEARFVLPPQEQHVHSSSVVELPGGDLFAVWYRGSGERRADDVFLEGARLTRGGSAWSPPFPVADSPGFPDCNPVALVDVRGRLSVVWPTILDNRWESALLRFRTAPVAGWTAGAPPWNDGGVILLRPDNLKEKTEPFARVVLAALPPGRDRDEVAQLVERLSDPLYNRLGWMPRTHALRLPRGRILLPLYSDTYNIGLVAISDDDGVTWRASDPIVSLGGVQPSLVRQRDGTVVAWMRDNGPPPQRVIVSSSRDDGVTWSQGEDSGVPNPGSSLEVIALRDGSWLMVLNDTESGRARLSAWVSVDEGRSWPHRRVIEDTPGGSYSYPSVLQAADGLIHVTYSHVAPAPDQGKRREAIKHVAFDAAWVVTR